MVIYS